MGATVMIGPSGSGKTTYLAAIEQAVLRTDPDSYIAGARLLASPNCRQFFKEARSGILTGGKFSHQANQVVQKYNFRVEVAFKMLKGFLADKSFGVDVECLDTPGEWILGSGEENNPSAANVVASPEEKSGRAELVEDLKKAENVILCLDSQHGDKNVYALYTNLLDLFYVVGDGKPMPWKHLAIVLTKADIVGMRFGNAALAKARDSNPVSTLEKLVSTVLIRQIMQYCEKTQVAVGWVSAFGFTQNGTPNFDHHKQTLLECGKPYTLTQVIDRWRPFQVLDAFSFIASSGQKLGGMRLMPRR